jgi:hypothetical protein
MVITTPGYRLRRGGSSHTSTARFANHESPEKLLAAGRIIADRQECKVYLRDGTESVTGYSKGWNIRHTADLTEAVWFYVRGEEYPS